MQTADLLGTVERDAGHRDAAQAWYRRALKLAEDLGDQPQQGVTSQNLGVLLQQEALDLPHDQADRRRALLIEATDWIGRSLDLKRQRQDRLGQASSLFQLGVLHLDLGDLARAEEHLLQSLAIFEPLDHPDVWKLYANLEDLAAARHDPTAAAWRAKKEAKQAELARRHTVGRPASLPPSLAQALPALASEVYQARVACRPTPLPVVQALQQLQQAPAPLDAIGRHLQALADGQLPDPPPDLPGEAGSLLSSLTEALRQLPAG